MIQAKNDEIYAAIKTGDLKKLQTWVESGNRFKRKWFDLTDGSNNALRFAVECEQFETVKWLVEVCKQPVCSSVKTNIVPEIRDHSVQEVYDGYDAAELAICKNNYELATWLIEHEVDRTAIHEELFSELFVRASPEEDYAHKSENYEFFKRIWVLRYHRRIDCEELDEEESYLNRIEQQMSFDYVLRSAPFEWAKWIIAESGTIPELKTRLFFTLMEREEASFEECTALIKWMIESSGQLIDCQDWYSDCREWEEDQAWSMYGAKFVNSEVMTYVDSVSEMQEHFGLEKWFEGIQAKKRLDDGKQRRRL